MMIMIPNITKNSNHVSNHIDVLTNVFEGHVRGVQGGELSHGISISGPTRRSHNTAISDSWLVSSLAAYNIMHMIIFCIIPVGEVHYLSWQQQERLVIHTT